jgi:hypothetical protein
MAGTNTLTPQEDPLVEERRRRRAARQSASPMSGIVNSSGGTNLPSFRTVFDKLIEGNKKMRKANGDFVHTLVKAHVDQWHTMARITSDVLGNLSKTIDSEPDSSAK